MRFYDIDAGRITLDGVDIATMRRGDLRGRTGMVLQDTWLFGGTIRDNIAYGRPDASEEEILEAARATFVDRFVHNLPDGYDTVVDEEGSSISAGERQLVTIARAFLADPALLILDEATSSVDTRTELLLQQAMAALRTDRTSFVIAHRLSTIRDADLILVMEDGAIVEQGTHDELLAADGAYAALYQSQFAARRLRSRRACRCGVQFPSIRGPSLPMVIPVGVPVSFEAARLRRRTPRTVVELAQRDRRRRPARRGRRTGNVAPRREVPRGERQSGTPGTPTRAAGAATRRSRAAAAGEPAKAPTGDAAAPNGAEAARGCAVRDRSPVG